MCFYPTELNEEETSLYSVCVTLDGNFSLKRRDRQAGQQGDAANEPFRHFNSKYRLSNDFVELFANQTISADRTTGDSCEDNWQAVRDDPQVIKQFDENGVFMLTCCHGMAMGYADMIREAEGFKFGLSLVRWMLDQVPGRVTIGYDVACVFSKTFTRAPIMEDIDHTRVGFRK